MESRGAHKSYIYRVTDIKISPIVRTEAFFKDPIFHTIEQKQNFCYRIQKIRIAGKLTIASKASHQYYINNIERKKESNRLQGPTGEKIRGDCNFLDKKVEEEKN